MQAIMSGTGRAPERASTFHPQKILVESVECPMTSASPCLSPGRIKSGAHPSAYEPTGTLSHLRLCNASCTAALRILHALRALQGLPQYHARHKCRITVAV